ncbi:molecular chaperone TorD [Shewanella sp. Choline-02u-19]|uniref:TorD/DmsD family molecular chaperone n=1 Tax=unclassified Shewanella TaxID=196818 RepID=UPI000C327E1E|nr:MULTISPECIES: molecular chaperone TorD family protein [unclassified Shewanella]PKH54976.1 molecular chaperone TorD [Shewanella sp. Bg11-22]PKI26748.1 molecular chaperone TorD [Shewanella sp. Choline-02u-19]
MSSNTASINTVDFIEYQGLARILHHCLIRYPEAELVQGLKDCDVAGSWPVFANNKQNSQGREALTTFLQQWQSDDHSEQLIELKLDYGRLFFGPGEPKAVPQGSVYLSEAQLLNDRSTTALMDFYRAHGVEVAVDYPQPVDHIGLFFAVLDQTFGRLELEADNQALIRFTQVLLQQHFLPWAYRCFELALADANTDFYRGIALLGNDFLLQMQQDFQLLPKETRLYR